MALTSASAAPGEIVSLNLQMNAPADARPAALEWTVNAPTPDVQSITAVAGPAASAASKSLYCSDKTCVIAGSNAIPIANGTIAVLSLHLSASAKGNLAIQLSNTSAASPQADPIPLATTSGEVFVIAPPGISITLSPGTVSLGKSHTQVFVPTVTGTTNHVVTWSINPPNVGTFSNGIYTAPSTITTAQTVTITATSQADPTKQATATINLVPATAVVISPTSVRLTAGTSQVFTAIVSGMTNSKLTWTVSPVNVGTFTNGVYTAPSPIASPQIVTITVTDNTDPTKSATAIIVLEPTSHVSLSPATVVLSGGQSQQFTPAVTASSSTSVKWSVSPGNVGVFSNGIYTAPTVITSEQTITITATSGADPARSASSVIRLVPLSTPILQLHADATEVSGLVNGSIERPSSGPPGFAGTVVVNGTGSLNFTPVQGNSGVYFLNCCKNANTAYYKFTGSTLGNIFNVNQGQISFYLKSRHSFAQRRTTAAERRFAFHVRDKSNDLFYFWTQVNYGSLQFGYAIGGVPQFYQAPPGTEDTLFGSGVVLKVTLTWNGSALNLYLNDKLVKSSAYTPAAPNWTAASTFDLGAYEYLTYGGFNSSDDAISEFTVLAKH